MPEIRKKYLFARIARAFEMLVTGLDIKRLVTLVLKGMEEFVSACVEIPLQAVQSVCPVRIEALDPFAFGNISAGEKISGPELVKGVVEVNGELFLHSDNLRLV